MMWTKMIPVQIKPDPPSILPIVMNPFSVFLNPKLNTMERKGTMMNVVGFYDTPGGTDIEDEDNDEDDDEDNEGEDDDYTIPIFLSRRWQTFTSKSAIELSLLYWATVSVNLDVVRAVLNHKPRLPPEAVPPPSLISVANGRHDTPPHYAPYPEHTDLLLLP
jgi:hypothetical protein